MSYSLMLQKQAESFMISRSNHLEFLADWTFKFSHDFKHAEQNWRAFERNALHTPYQKFDFQEAWWQEIGCSKKLELLIVEAHYKGALSFILPLCIERHTISKASYLCSKHSNYNMPLIALESFHSLQKTVIDAFFSMISERFNIDVVALEHQPLQWENIDNPFAQCCGSPSVATSFKTSLDKDFETFQALKRSGPSLRKLRQKHKKLSRYGILSFEAVQDEAALTKTLSTFFEQKKKRFSQLGLKNVFETEKGARSFLMKASHNSLKNKSQALQWYVLKVDDEIVATYAGGISAERISFCVNSLCHNEKSKYGPTDILLQMIIKYFCENNFKVLDLGIGHAAYKEAWCEADPLSDCTLGLSLKGKLYVHTLHAKRIAKTNIKKNNTLWMIAKKIRKILNQATQ